MARCVEWGAWSGESCSPLGWKQSGRRKLELLKGHPDDLSLPSGLASKGLHLSIAPCQDQPIGWYGVTGTSAEQWEMRKEGGSKRALGMLKEAEPAHRMGLAS